jgi:hypothetical protein
MASLRACPEWSEGFELVLRLALNKVKGAAEGSLLSSQAEFELSASSGGTQREAENAWPRTQAKRAVRWPLRAPNRGVILATCTF